MTARAHSAIVYVQIANDWTNVNTQFVHKTQNGKNKMNGVRENAAIRNADICISPVLNWESCDLLQNECECIKSKH